MEPSFVNEDALVILSGGQDSTTCLFWAENNFRKVYAISFLYGQKHIIEVSAAERICARLEIEHKVADMSFISEIAESRLFAGQGNIDDKGHPLRASVPSSFVPYRNLFFLTAAAAWASTLRVKHLVAGMCETDSSGYADCRDVFIKSTQVTFKLATDFDDLGAVIHTPLMWLTKAETFRLAETLGCLDIIINDTVTCYYGIEDMHDYGKGCGKCPACLIREKGYREYVQKYRQQGNTDGKR
jgi:7-cyano-7-deazaguanine synthase